MKRYLVFDGINSDHQYFDTLKECHNYIHDYVYEVGEGFHPDMDLMAIFELKESVSHEVIDKKSNYKYEYESEIPEEDTESEAWPYNTDYDEIWEIKYIPAT